MKAIFKRELKSYFTSPLIYIIISVYLIYSMIMFSNMNVSSHSPELIGLIMSCNFLMHLLVPFLTMKLFSEEKTQKTDQLLLTSPNSITSIVMGKYISAVVIATIMTVTVAVYGIVISCVTTFDWSAFLLQLVGSLFINVALVSVGLFISAVFGNMIVSALVTLGIMLFINNISLIESYISGSKMLTGLYRLIDLTGKFNDFYMGLLSIESIVYYLSFAAIFVFFSIRAIDKKRWD